MRVYSAIIGIAWLVFWLYWISSAFQSKRSIAPRIRRFVGLRILLLVVIIVVVDAAFPQSAKNHLPITNKALLATGFILFVLGISLAVWARITMGKDWGMPMTVKEEPKLVTNGPFHYIRNPIYTGIILMSLGSAIDVNVFWWGVFAIATIYFVYSAVTEEKIMKKQFPKTYPDYKARTKMFLPYIF